MMTQFKVGDRVLVKTSTFDPIPETMRMVGKICEVNHVVGSKLIAVWDEEKNDYWIFHTSDLYIAHTTPPETIQHEGYNYTRGEPIVPEWVKDGAWVVDKVHDRVLQMRSHDLGGYNLYDQKGNLAYLDANISSRELFRPFTNEDWKWGMWGEYKGEKVFVCSAVGHKSVAICRSPELSGERIDISVVTSALVENLIPTTAP